jgi:hypothetical protein
MFLFWKRVAVIILCFLLLIFIYGSLFMPKTWQWGASNLHVMVHHSPREGVYADWGGEGASWSKLSFFTGDWWRLFGPGTSDGGNQHFIDSCDTHIAWVTREGVSVRVRYEQKVNEVTAISFDRWIFIPATNTARIDVTPDISITGKFE